MSTIRFNNLPSDILFELFGYLELQDIFAVEQVSRHLRTLIRSSRAIWLSVTATLGKELPLPYPPLRPHSSLQTLELRDVALRSLILDRSWRSKVTKPARQPRLLEFPETKNEKVSMLRLLPGAKQVLTVTNNGGLACWDVRTGILLSQWHHGGVKLESLDVDVCHADQGLHFMLAVSIEHHYQIENQIYPTHRLYAVRIEILDDTDVPGEGARFVPVAETCWQMPFYIVSIEGDIVAAYSCELDQQPIPQPLATFIVCIMNWQNKTAAMVQIPVEVIGFWSWPTMQVLDQRIILHEERRDLPAVCVFRVPDVLYPIFHNVAAPQVSFQPTVIHTGGEQLQPDNEEEGMYQTRFSKLWRNPDAPAGSRKLSILGVSHIGDNTGQHKVIVRTFDPFPDTENLQTTLPVQHLWHKQGSRFPRDPEHGILFTFCLGRYGSRPIWIEEHDQCRKLMGLTTHLGEPKEIQIHGYMDILSARFLDWDDAEGTLCFLDAKGLWVVEFL